MEITLENLRKYVKQYGVVSILDSTGQAQKLQDGTPDVWELAERADRFRCDGRWHDRSAMEKILDRLKPANAAQISHADVEHMEE
jgi:hypothetical protein